MQIILTLSDDANLAELSVKIGELLKEHVCTCKQGTCILRGMECRDVSNSSIEKLSRVSGGSTQS